MKKNRNSLNAPSIQISNSNDLYDSGIGQDVGSSKYLPRPISRNGKTESDGGSSLGSQLNGLDQNGGFMDNGIQLDLDPLEYEFLKQQANSGDVGENGVLMDSLAIHSNSLNGSQSSLVS